MKLVWIVIPLVLFGVMGFQESYSQTENLSDTIPELFIYDDETANAILPTGKTIEGYAIQHEFTKVNMDAFDSNTILFNFFNKTITVYKIDQIGKFWYGSTTADSDYRTVQITLHGEMISGSVSYNHDFFTITPLGQNDLYILKQLDRSNSSDEPEGWYETLPNRTSSYNERIGYDSGYDFTSILISIILIIGFTIFVIYYKKRRKVKL